VAIVGRRGSSVVAASGGRGGRLVDRGGARRRWGPHGGDGGAALWPEMSGDGEPSVVEEGSGLRVGHTSAAT
jgi:hypothetical protein